MKKLEHYSVVKVVGDGRCMFRALVSFFIFSSQVDFFRALNYNVRVTGKGTKG